MDAEELNRSYRQFKAQEDSFHHLMSRRVREVLLVSTFYDAFIFEHDGRLSEQLYGEYQQLNLSTAPRITGVPTGRQALQTLAGQPFDLVVTMLRIGEPDPFEMAAEIKRLHPGLPVLLLLNVDSDVALAQRRMQAQGAIDDVFLWTGDTKLFLAMIKLVEDRLNAEEDTRQGLVRTVLLVEDSIRYYSRFLPILYAQIMQQTQRLISEELSDIHKRLRMRARPKVLLAHDWETAAQQMERHADTLIAVLSDVSYPHAGKEDPAAGVNLIGYLRQLPWDGPAVRQRGDEANRAQAERLQARFLCNHSPAIMHDLQDIMCTHWGYGDFVFRGADGRELGRAANLAEFRRLLHAVPKESLLYHGARNHFSGWLIAHGDLDLAREIRPVRIRDFADGEALRHYLNAAFERVWRQRTRGRIINYNSDRLGERGHIVRLAEGSLGGKARGLAFLNVLLAAMDMPRRHPQVQMSVPATAVIGTAEFDRYVAPLDTLPTAATDDFFRYTALSPLLPARLGNLVETMSGPLAVRSSGVLEDSGAVPLAGLYRTEFLSNTGETAVRLRRLSDAVLRVFASVFGEEARRFLAAVHHNPGEEKLAVIVQELSGRQVAGVFAPEWSGRVLWNRERGCGVCRARRGFDHEGALTDAEEATPEGWPPNLRLLLSREPGLALPLDDRPGPVFCPPGACFPPEVGAALADVADLLAGAMHASVELEFAVPVRDPVSLDLLQVRAISQPEGEDPGEPDLAPVFFLSNQGGGHGRIEGLRDVILLRAPTQDASAAAELRMLNEALAAEEREYLLLGPGYWGAPEAGVPITWRDIDRARVILQTDAGAERERHRAHFLRNLAVLDIPYLVYRPHHDTLDLAWLQRQPVHARTAHYLHYRLARPLAVRMDGRTGSISITHPQDESYDFPIEVS